MFDLLNSRYIFCENIPTRSKLYNVNLLSWHPVNTKWFKKSCLGLAIIFVWIIIHNECRAAFIILHFITANCDSGFAAATINRYAASLAQTM